MGEVQGPVGRGELRGSLANKGESFWCEGSMTTGLRGGEGKRKWGGWRRTQGGTWKSGTSCWQPGKDSGQDWDPGWSVL